ncbi:hypothetical protein [Mycolicibacterium sp. XJ1819]
MTGTASLIVGLLAQTQPRETGPDFGKASPFGLLVIVLLLIGVFLLVRSMNRHLRKVPKSFDDVNPENADGTEGPGTPTVVDTVDEPEPPADGPNREPDS